MGSPTHPHLHPYDPGPPAPHLTKSGTCSDCEVMFVWAGGTDYKICPECYSVLWHTDWTIAERLERSAAAAAAKQRIALAAQTRKDNQAKRRHVSLFAEDLVVSSPVLGVPDDN